MRIALVFSIFVLPAGMCHYNDEHTHAPSDQLLFCDGAKVREFGTQEWRWREANSPTNLAKDLAHNEIGEQHCGWDAPG